MTVHVMSYPNRVFHLLGNHHYTSSDNCLGYYDSERLYHTHSLLHIHQYLQSRTHCAYSRKCRCSCSVSTFTSDAISCEPSSAAALVSSLGVSTRGCVEAFYLVLDGRVMTVLDPVTVMSISHTLIHIYQAENIS